MNALPVTSVTSYAAGYGAYDKNRKKSEEISNNDGEIAQALEHMKRSQDAKAEKNPDNEPTLPKTLDNFPAMGMAQARVLLKALAMEIKGSNPVALANAQPVDVTSMLPSQIV